jgi:hypothetical protein
MCSTHGGNRKCIQTFDRKELKLKYRLRDLDVDGRIILECTLKKRAEKMFIGFSWHRVGHNGGIL